MSYRFNNKGLALSVVEGFTLIEMIVVIAIFGIVTTVVLANLPTFRDRSSLDLVAQEVAINIRGAQVAGASGQIQSTTGQPTWRINFKKANFGSPSTFWLYRDGIDKAEPEKTFTLSANFVLESMCLVVSGDACDLSPFDTLDIIFTRPNLEPKFVKDNTTPVLDAVSARIVVKALRSDETRRIEVYNNGQISVVKP
ncbi:MAG: type II secretion system protein [bacterium]|nr:type II secretion system protein [bacterium]